ncbi:MAG: histidine--tRNA ligase [Lachnospiraceae bacterium]|nr:histidine--tRNA ligase [Lachnospiraceae bacterium]MDY5496488.1 histidine--tRNA ligase [Anaerobutyricum sp.]
MKITPVKGTNDYLPVQAELRDYLQKKICETYELAGFQRITTPIIEDIENLDKSEGGDNLNLIFKVMKRGEKLKKAIATQDPGNIADMGLRYDLTLPLSRYYANNRASLPHPFKVIQMDRVYRAERPQKGRLREFMQCDIDILGSDSPNCEIELIHTTAKALLNIGIDHFKVKINDRRILREILLSVGFKEDQLDSVCISFDKLHKIHEEGVEKELMEKGFDPDVIKKFMELLSHAPFTLDYVKQICKNTEYVDSLSYIIRTSNELADGKYEAEYDMTLVRGQGYYTGTVFEIESLDFNSSIAGGGRYDNLIGKFLKEQIPAVGFSIGFERIYSILMERESYHPDRQKKVVLIYEEDQIEEAIRYAEKLRQTYKTALYIKPKKLGKFLNKLEEQGFDGFMVLGRDEKIRMFGE